MIEIRRTRLEAADGTGLAAYEAGSGPGPALVLVNGLGGNIDAWQYFVNDFGGYHRVVSWDYRGLYHSEATAGGTDYTVSTQADDLRAVLDHFGIRQAVLVGWSMGVQVSFELYRHHPERVLGLVLINGTFGRPFATAFAPLLKQSPLVPLLPAAMRALESVAHLASPLQPMAKRVVRARGALVVLRALGLVSETLDERVFVTLAEQVAGLNLPRYMATLNSLGDHCAEAILPQVQVPVLIVTGDRDLFTPVAVSHEMAKRIPEAELLVIPSGTHYTPIEFPELIHLRVQKFLRTRLGYDRDAAAPATAPDASTPAAAASDPPKRTRRRHTTKTS